MKTAVTDVDVSDLENTLSELLKSSISALSVKLQQNKYSDTYFLKINGMSPNLSSLVLKEVDTDETDLTKDHPTYYDFYKEVLEPFDLDSPRIYGVVKFTGRLFLVCEHITHERPGRRKALHYRRVLAWLQKKDLVFSKLSRNIPCNYIDSRMSLHEHCLGILENAFAHDVVPWKQSDEYEAIRDFFLENVALLDRGVQTVSHNDLHVGNVLFGKDERAESIYVIDWTFPNWCSVTFDLAYLLDTAPNELRSQLISEYRQKIDFREFDTLLAFSTLVTRLVRLSWLTFDAINDGDSPVLQERINSFYTGMLKEIQSCPKLAKG